MKENCSNWKDSNLLHIRIAYGPFTYIGYTWRTTVNSSQPLAAGDFDRLMLLPATFHEPTQLWAIDAAGPHLWNNLPLHLRDFELSLSEFRRLLKTHLFG